MWKSNLLVCFAVLCLSSRKVNSQMWLKRYIKDVDVFQATEIDTFELRHRISRPAIMVGTNPVPPVTGKSEMDKLNDLLVDSTDSVDPHKNLDIVLDSLNSDYKDKGPIDSPPIRAKRLFLALSTLAGEALCSYYGYVILSKNFHAIDTVRPSLIEEGRTSHRIDIVLRNFILEHSKNCRQTYFTKFDELSSNLNETMMRRINLSLSEAMKILASEQDSENKDMSAAEKLFDIATGKMQKLSSKYIFDAVIDSSKSDSVDGSLISSRDMKGLSKKEKESRLYQAFHKMLVKPCQYLIDRLGPEVFEPYLFDLKYAPPLQPAESRIDFYEAFIKYKFCDLGDYTGIIARLFIEYGLKNYQDE